MVSSVLRCRLSFRVLTRQSVLYSRSMSSGKPIPAATANDAEALKEDSQLPFLQKPLGVRDPPSSAKKTKDEIEKEYMDKDKRLERRKHLVKEATKGYYHDLNATRRHGGKTWIAPRGMIREDKALYFPDIVGKNLANGEATHTTDLCRGKISIISMLGTTASEQHSRGFTARANAVFSDNPLYSFIQINLQENILRSLLVKMFVSSIKKTVPRHLQAKYLVSSQNMEYEHEVMGMDNKHVGYVYLVDQNVKIRWAGCADALPEESVALEAATGVLLKRLETDSQTQPNSR